VDGYDWGNLKLSNTGNVVLLPILKNLEKEGVKFQYILQHWNNKRLMNQGFVAHIKELKEKEKQDRKKIELVERKARAQQEYQNKMEFYSIRFEREQQSVYSLVNTWKFDVEQALDGNNL
jgi:hypothetical protein